MHITRKRNPMLMIKQWMSFLPITLILIAILVAGVYSASAKLLFPTSTFETLTEPPAQELVLGTSTQRTSTQNTDSSGINQASHSSATITSLQSEILGIKAELRAQSTNNDIVLLLILIFSALLIMAINNEIKFSKINNIINK